MNLEQADFVAELASIKARIDAKLATPEGQAQQAEIARQEAEDAAKAEENERERPYKRLADCGVPRRIIDTIRNYDPTRAVKRVVRWAEDRSKRPENWCLVLSADKGLGKSVAAGLWMLQSGAQTIRFTERTGDVVNLPSWWPVSKFARMESYDGKFDALCNHSGPVVIDDIGSEYRDKNGWFLQAFDAFIDARYSQYRPTLITTNLSAEDFKRTYSGRVVDRIREGGSYYEFDGESLRGKAVVS